MFDNLAISSFVINGFPMISRQSRLADVFAPGLQKTSGEARKNVGNMCPHPLVGATSLNVGYIVLNFGTSSSNKYLP